MTTADFSRRDRKDAAERPTPSLRPAHTENGDERMSVPFPSQEQLDRGSVMRAERRMAVHAARKGRKITTTRPDICDACGQPVPVGTSAWWSRGAGVVHDNPDCLAGLGIDEYRPSHLTVSQITERELQAAEQARNEYVLGRLEDADDEAAWRGEVG